MSQSHSCSNRTNKQVSCEAIDKHDRDTNDVIPNPVPVATLVSVLTPFTFFLIFNGRLKQKKRVEMGRV